MAETLQLVRERIRRNPLVIAEQHVRNDAGSELWHVEHTRMRLATHGAARFTVWRAARVAARTYHPSQRATPLGQSWASVS